MKATTVTWQRPLCRQIDFSFQQPRLGFPNFKGAELYGHRAVSSFCGAIRAVNGGERANGGTAWDEKPYDVLSAGRRVYLDEEDVVTFLDPPKELIPLDPTSYNPASYLWKKIEDIPEERRHRLLHLLKPRLISRAWQIAGTRYEDPMLAKKIASKLLSSEDGVMSLEFWNCRKSGGPLPISWINFFKKAIFCCKDGKAYGRFIGKFICPKRTVTLLNIFFFGCGPVLSGFANSIYPLYFMVRQCKEVMATEHPCDLAYEFGDGLWDIQDFPPGFPKAAKHPWPFNDQVVIYVRHVGPGVLVGQAWQEGKALEQLPQKLCSEILMVKDYAAAR
ncbi:uncharacterized protein LOC117921582 isoform X1 [Vitis riparia]|uniref:uncharacterized protein LOC117921582 isoform X1 n=1 Tax=Vitis riparia TaxID=96939 RepID=UPI00155AF0DD|nr:uncharacterized protein LOC117921582 isoform X1 [Vitis riparia]